MIRRLCCTGALALGLLATSVPSAHAATVSPSEWAPKFCTTLEQWQSTIQEKGDALTSALDNVEANGQDQAEILDDARDQISDFLGDMVDATDEATSDIKSAGAPSSPNGAKISLIFVKGFKAISKEFAKAQDKAEKLPTNSVTAFEKQGKQLGQALSDSSSRLGNGFSSIGKLDKGKKLEAAVKAAPECSFLT
jgi:hypothetical protein